MNLLYKSWMRKRMGWAAIGLSGVYWIVESMLDSFVYGLGPLDSRIVTPDLNETIMRLLAIGLLISFGFYAQVTVDRMARTEARLTGMNECFVSFGINPMENIQRLTESCGVLLKSSASFYSLLEDGKLHLWGRYGTLLHGEDGTLPQGQICRELMETKAIGPRLIPNLDTSLYAKKDPWIAVHRLKTYFGQVVRIGPEPVGSLCSFFDRDVVPSEEEKRLTQIIASAIGIEEQRHRAQKIIEDSEHQLKVLSAQLLSAQETERKRIAMQLHDSIGQSLSAVKFSIEESLERLIPLVSPEKLSSLEAAVSLIQEVMRELRGMLKSLRPAMLDDLGILATIAWLCREIENIYKGITVERHTELDEEEIPGHLKTAMFRILQEALNNAVKHSECDRILLELRQNGEFIELEVRDNGKGLPRHLPVSDPESETGMGLSSMRERAELSGGRFYISSEPGEGTQILVSWPREG